MACHVDAIKDYPKSAPPGLFTGSPQHSFRWQALPFARILGQAGQFQSLLFILMLVLLVAVLLMKLGRTIRDKINLKSNYNSILGLRKVHTILPNVLLS